VTQVTQNHGFFFCFIRLRDAHHGDSRRNPARIP